MEMATKNKVVIRFSFLIQRAVVLQCSKITKYQANNNNNNNSNK